MDKISPNAWQVNYPKLPYHFYDKSLMNGLVRFFQYEKVMSIISVGTGVNIYSDTLRSNGIFSNCYDDNPNIQNLSEGRCAMIDLTSEVKLTPHEWVVSLETGERIPKEYEDVFIQNIARINTRGIILSWAIEEQHECYINCRDNNYIKDKITSLGYINDMQLERDLRDVATFSWLKTTLMVFRKEDINIQDVEHESYISDFSYYDF